MMPSQESEPKPTLRSKLSIIYEKLFQGEKVDDDIWEELFLLKVNIHVLDTALSQLTTTDLINLKKTLNELFRRCVDVLGQENYIKSLNVLLTLSVVIKNVWRKDLGDGFRAVDVLIGFNDAEERMKMLLLNIHYTLTSTTVPLELKNSSLSLLIVILSLSDNISQNTMVEYLMLQPMWGSLTKVAVSPSLRPSLGNITATAIALLLSYRKHEYSNPYVGSLSSCDDDLVMNAFSEIFLNSMTNYNNKKQSTQKVPSYTEYMTSWLTWSSYSHSDDVVADASPKIDVSIVLCFYELLYHNKNFTSFITQTMTSINKTENDTHSELHSNLLSAFITFSSHVFASCKDNTSLAHLVLNILICLSEDSYVEAFIHDENQVFSVHIFRAKFRHRKEIKEEAAMPLAYSLLELLSEFILSNLTKSFNVELYSKCYRVIHRILCYQKKARIRLSYEWKHLWNALISAIKWCSNVAVEDTDHLIEHHIEVCRIFNMFVMYGDTFLSNHSSYDVLYYEILRQHTVFETLNQTALNYVNTNEKGRCKVLLGCLHNIRTIGNHFAPKIEAWSMTTKTSTPTPEQVMDIVRSNYDTLTLKLQDGLAHYEKYNEVKEQQLFTTLVRGICSEKRDVIKLSVDSAVYQKCASIA